MGWFRRRTRARCTTSRSRPMVQWTQRPPKPFGIEIASSAQLVANLTDCPPDAERLIVTGQHKNAHCAGRKCANRETKIGRRYRKIRDTEDLHTFAAVCDS